MTFLENGKKKASCLLLFNEIKEGVVMYVARDEDGELWLYEEKPEKILHSWAAKCGWFSALPSFALPEVKWEDKEPRELALKPIKEK